MSCIWKILFIFGVLVNVAIKVNGLNSQNLNLYMDDGTDSTEDPIEEPEPQCVECGPGTDSCKYIYYFYTWYINSYDCLFQFLKLHARKQIVQVVHV